MIVKKEISTSLGRKTKKKNRSVSVLYVHVSSSLLVPKIKGKKKIKGEKKKKKKKKMESKEILGNVS